MHDEIGELTVVCQDEKARGIQVEPSDREEPPVLFWDEFQNRPSTLRIVEGADISPGLVKKEISIFLFFLSVYFLPVDFDVVALQAGKPERDDLPVDLDAALTDEFLGFSSGAVTERGEDLLYSFFFHGKGILTKKWRFGKRERLRLTKSVLLPAIRSESQKKRP